MLPTFLSDTRLYELTWRDEAGPDLPVEAWWGREALSGGFEICIDLLATDTHLELKRFLGRSLTLNTRLSDGGQASRSGLVRAAQKLGADGGFARYRLTVVPWVWLLSRGRHNRVFQEKTVIDIVEAVFADYSDVAAWQWSDEVAGFWPTPGRAATACNTANPTMPSSPGCWPKKALAGVSKKTRKPRPAIACASSPTASASPKTSCRNPPTADKACATHRADSQEDQDAILAFGERHRLASSVISAITYDYKAKKNVTLNIPSAQPIGGKNAPVLESHDHPGLYTWANAAEAERYGRLAMEAREAGHRTWLGRSTVRSQRPGTAFDLIGLPIDPAKADAEHRYTPTDITHLGINNLSGEAIAAIAQRLGQGPQKIDAADALATGDTLTPISAPTSLPAELLKLAVDRGYGNTFDAHAANTPWRPELEDRSGARINPRPTAPGPMSAIVVGPEGQTSANGSDELWCDALGRVKIRFHWQQAETPDDRDSCWVRVLSRQAGAGMGWQWLPRIGQEVLVDFVGGDIDRPYLLGALYNGQGEGGIAATPGGESTKAQTDNPFDAAADHRPGGQGNTASGNSPAWHGAAESSHRHSAALTGFKSKEFGSATGYNQLLLDDSDQQQRLQLKSTQHTSELNLGHLIHQADNYRGSFRGTGSELRTDAWGALRGGQGLVMSTWAHPAAGVSTAQPAGDMSPAMALLRQADTLAKTLNQAAATHQTVQLSSAIGTQGKDQSKIDPEAAPLKALHKVSSGMVDAKDQSAAKQDAQQKSINASPEKRPHLTDPAIVQTGKAGIGHVAGQNLQYTNGETLVFESGEDTNLAIAGKARIHSGQAIGLLAGAIAPGDGNTGLKLIAAKDDIDLQAQSDEMKFLAKKDIKLVSATQHIDFAAAKKIHIAVQGGASITIDGGITVQCPGTITVHASKKSFTGPEKGDYALPAFPQNVCVECLLKAMNSGSALAKV